MKELKEILGKELYERVNEKLGDDKIAIVSDGNWIPKKKFDEVNKQKNIYKFQLDILSENMKKMDKLEMEKKVLNRTIEDMAVYCVRKLMLSEGEEY